MANGGGVSKGLGPGESACSPCRHGCPARQPGGI